MLKNKKLNIVHITEAWDIPNGVVVMASSLARAQAAAGHQVRIIAPTPFWRPCVPERHGEVWVYFVPALPLPGGTGYMIPLPWVSGAVNRICKEADILHTHHPSILGVWALGFRKPVIFTAHTNYVSYLHYAGIAGTLLKWQMVRHIGRFGNRCTSVVAPAPLQGERLKTEYGVRQSPMVIWNGIDPSRFSQGDGSLWRSRLQLTYDMPVFVYVGRLSKEKRVDMLIQAIAIHPTAHLVLVGAGQQQLFLRRMAKEHENTGSRIHFVGAVPNEQLVDLYSMADCFVSASDSEICPLTPIEAQMAGCPALVMDAPGSSEVVEHGVSGWVVENTFTALSKGIREVAAHVEQADGALRHVRAKARQYALQHFSVAVMAERYERHYYAHLS